MKKLFLALCILAAQQVFAQAPSNILTAYYGVKDALVAGDADAAGKNAGELSKAITAADKTTLTDKLNTDAKAIAGNKDIETQRKHFQTLSTNMVALARSVKLSDKPIYQEYCPMKKAIWLSDKSAIKNPYYGDAMLTCGSVQTTLKP